MVIAGKLKEIVVDSVLSSILPLLKKGKENFEWKKLFVDTGEFLVNDSEKSNEFYDDSLRIFSKENMKKMASELKGKSGYELRKSIYQALYELMSSYIFGARHHAVNLFSVLELQ